MESVETLAKKNRAEGAGSLVEATEPTTMACEISIGYARPVLGNRAGCSTSPIPYSGFAMKWYHIVHAAVTLLLSVAITLFLVLLLTGVIEIRSRSVQANKDPSQPPLVGGAKARLLVMRGLRPNWEYQLFEGRNVIGRADQQPVDIDLQPREPEDRVWSSRQHAVIICEGDVMAIEDLFSANGTYVNRSIVPPGTKRPLQVGDIIQIGEVQLKVLSANEKPWRHEFGCRQPDKFCGTFEPIRRSILVQQTRRAIEGCSSFSASPA
jgi:hypothetical protein